MPPTDRRLGALRELLKHFMEYLDCGRYRYKVRALKRESAKGLFTAGVKLPQALTELGLNDEYGFVVQPRLARADVVRGAADLWLVRRLEFGSGVVAMRYEPRR